MKSFIEYICETQISNTAQIVQDVLMSSDFMKDDFKYVVRDRKSTQPSNVIVLDIDGNDNDRVEMFDKIATRITQGKYFDNAVYNDTPITGGVSCTKGAVEITTTDQHGNPAKVKVIVKSKNRTGSGTAGVQNEVVLSATISQHISEGPITVEFIEEGNSAHKFVCEEVTGVESVGTDVSNNKKGDVKIYGKKEYIISIKKLTADFWASCTGKGNATAEDGAILLSALLDLGEVKNIKATSNVSETLPINITLNCSGITWPLSEEQAKTCVFGSDITEGNGCIVEQTFSSKNMSFDPTTNTLTVMATKVISKLTDISADDYPTFFIQNAAGHQLAGKYNGVRLLAARQRRVRSGNVYKLKRDRAIQLMEEYKNRQEQQNNNLNGQ